MEPNDKLQPFRETGNQSLLWKIEDFEVAMRGQREQSELTLRAAQEFTISSEGEYQLAVELKIELEAAAKLFDDQRMPLTRPFDEAKAHLMDLVKPAIANNKAGASLYNQKALAYLREERTKAEAARRQAEAEQRRKQDELNAAAAKREAEANKLKTKAAQNRALAEADALRQAAITTPASMALSAPAPQSDAANVVEKWLWEIQNWQRFCKWLGEHPEWLNERGSNNIVIAPAKAAFNKFANHYGDSIEIPGVRIWPEERLHKNPVRR
jgi:hypothetical protein